jgi:hypothetical protein
MLLITTPPKKAAIIPAKMIKNSVFLGTNIGTNIRLITTPPRKKTREIFSKRARCPK